MAQKIIDISKYINNDVPQMVLFGKTYTIKNDKKTVLLLTALQNEQNNNNVDDKIIKLLIGVEQGQEIIDILDNNPNYSENIKVVVLNLLSLATGTPYEVLEERFRKAQQ